MSNISIVDLMLLSYTLMYEIPEKNKKEHLFVYFGSRPDPH